MDIDVNNDAPCCCTGRTKERNEAELRSLTNRLSRIEGQIRGIRGMLDTDAYCIDILTQVAAAEAALSSFAKEMMASHIRGCVSENIRHGDGSSIDELVDTVGKLMR